MLEKILRTTEKIVPKKLYKFFQPAYHLGLAHTGALLYGYPSRKIKVIGVTGTKGKSSTTEFINAVLVAGGHKTAVLSTIHFKIGNSNRPNKYKMTMPGRFFVQKFLHDAVQAGCEYAIIEMTSEGARFYRHKGIEIDTLVFTNLSPEHIESHGSFEKYLAAKLELAKATAKSKKEITRIIANKDNEYGVHFMIYNVSEVIPYSLKEVVIKKRTTDATTFVYQGQTITIHLPGDFNVSNALAAIHVGETEKVPLEKIKLGLEGLTMIRGRVEKVHEGQDFDVVVDYAHTDDSLRKLYETFSTKRKICVLGSTGGGRDTWKRKVMGEIADTYCDEIILTNEDPYDEEPKKIVKEIAEGISKHEPEIIMDRRKAIRKALSSAKKGSIVLITGKGTDPYIMGPNGSKQEWDDARVVREELAKLKSKA
jgi:UDP-N-acetylmuramoyl-L-alanyl-D-glutamate--2,6-diaminopimelate ligase